MADYPIAFDAKCFSARFFMGAIGRCLIYRESDVTRIWAHKSGAGMQISRGIPDI